SLDDAYVETLAVQKAFLLEQKLIERDFDLEGWIDRGILAEAASLLRARDVAVPADVGT
ncbi:hypothetical protein HLH44_05515, partial [Gluconacetobacter sp. 1c LMG 22058]|nr:hypothetical protein [Gluconacetobacter dulcium]